MLTGKDTCLSAFEGADSEQLFAWINTPELVRLNAPFKPVHAASHAEWFAALGRDPSRIAFAIRSMPKRRLLGMVQLIEIHPVHRNAEMIIRIGAAADQGKGHGSAALRLLLDFAWRDLNLHRVAARAFATNKRAIAAYKKSGFVHEGTAREAAFIDGSWTDMVLFGAVNPGA
jgi:RimJ/RimL family protein N-acetyltransferase